MTKANKSKKNFNIQKIVYQQHTLLHASSPGSIGTRLLYMQPFPQSYYTFKRQATTDFQRKTRNKLVIVERKEN